MLATAAPTVAETNAVAARFLAEAPEALRGLIASLQTEEIERGMAGRVLGRAAARRVWNAVKAAGRSLPAESYGVSGRWGSLTVRPAAKNSPDIRVSYTSQTKAVWESR